VGHLSEWHGVEAGGVGRRMCNHTMLTGEGGGGEGSTDPIQKRVKGRSVSKKEQ
jgi:hypothetical protein